MCKDNEQNKSLHVYKYPHLYEEFFFSSPWVFILTSQ